MSESLLGDFLERWQQLFDRGTDAPAEYLCPDHPELHAELSRRIAALKSMNRLLFSDPTRTITYESAPSECSRTARPEIPGYEVLELLGEGGMGVVWKARQVSLDRLVALKLIRTGSRANDSDRARFQREARTIADLQHPGIVQIFEVGELPEGPFLALEFVAGGNLASKIDGKPMPAQQAAQLVLALARAMQLAHSRNIVHRDLKPANILLASPGRESGELIPKITDFGLAKRLDQVGDSVSGAILGTLSYMAPEQAEGRKDVGPLADVYALGAILYELLAGQPAFQGQTFGDILEKVLHAAPRRPSELCPGLPIDLEAVCLQCLEKEPRRRYASALELAEDLERFSQGQPVLARRVGWFGWVTRVVTGDRLRDDFRGWPAVLLGFAVVTLLAQTTLFALVQTGQPLGWSILTRTAHLVLMALVFWRHRPPRPLAASPAERQLFALWLGYLLACAVIALASRLANGLEEPFESILYLPWAVLSGLAFFSLGNSYWGPCYVLGLAFFVLAILMPLRLDWAPLGFGLLWTVSLLLIAGKLRRPRE